MKTVFLRALKADDKAAVLRAAIREPDAAHAGWRFDVNPTSFAAVPRSPFAYWVSDRLRRLFTELPALEAENRAARQGGVTGDDFRWLRLWMEATSTGRRGRYVPIAKGGTFSPFYADLLLQAWWDPERDTFWAFTGLPHRPSMKPASFDFYFRPGLTWPLRTNGLSLRAMAAGSIFGHKGPATFVENDDSDDLLALAAVLNSSAFALLVSLQLARTELAQSYEVGLIQNTPVPRLRPVDKSILGRLARRTWSLKRSLDTRTETSHAFSLPAVLQVEGDTLAARPTAWAQHVDMVNAELAAIQFEIDEECFDLYGIDESDRRAITEGFGDRTDESGEPFDPAAGADADGDDEGEIESEADKTNLVAELVSWAVGVAFGRFDMRLAIGERSLPPEPDPFDPLPACSPAMLTGDDGLPLATAPAGYPVDSPENGILVDDPGHPRDLTAAVHAVFDKVFGARADAMWQEAAALLDPRNHDLRVWLASSFFQHHLKRHSKSRRKAPILWQLGTASGRYSVWLYAHRLTRDSFFQLQNDVVAPKVAHEERQLTSLVQGAGGSPTATQRKEIAAQEAFVEELRAMLDEVKRVAPLWNPTLDDGVVLTMGALWRLVPQHKPWQKELKSKWDELAIGKYDWAQLAMHLWPERVVPKCATDRSLAIAHGLEEVFWAEGDNGKWQPRSAPVHLLEEIVRERTSAAVRAALQDLDAPAINHVGRRTANAA